MDKTEFIKLHDFDIVEAIDPDDIIENEAKQKAEKAKAKAEKEAEDSDDDDFMAGLGL